MPQNTFNNISCVCPSRLCSQVCTQAHTHTYIRLVFTYEIVLVFPITTWGAWIIMAAAMERRMHKLGNLKFLEIHESTQNCYVYFIEPLHQNFVDVDLAWIGLNADNSDSHYVQLCKPCLNCIIYNPHTAGLIWGHHKHNWIYLHTLTILSTKNK